MKQQFNDSYDYDKVTKVTKELGMPADQQTWFYKYDAKGQVTSADKRFSTGGASGAGYDFLPGHQAEYACDESQRIALAEFDQANAPWGGGY